MIEAMLLEIALLNLLMMTEFVKQDSRFCPTSAIIRTMLGLHYTPLSLLHFPFQEGGGKSEVFSHAGKFGVMVEALLLKIAGEPCAADFAYTPSVASRRIRHTVGS